VDGIRGRLIVSGSMHRLSALLGGIALATGLFAGGAPVQASGFIASLVSGSNSCTGAAACDSAVGPIGDNSCIGDFSCTNEHGAIGDGSCVGTSSCSSSTGSIGDGSCNGDSACQLEDNSVGNNSCDGTGACQGAAGSFGNNSCNGNYACALSSFPVGNNSCNGEGECYGLDTAVGDCTFNQFGYAPSACVQPDGEVRRSGGPLLGSDMYNFTSAGQRAYQGMRRHYKGAVRTVYLYIQNDGQLNSEYIFKASGAVVTGFDVSYHRASGSDVTSQVEAGTFVTPVLAPGQRYAIDVVIRITGAAASGTEVNRIVTMSAVGGEAAAKDVVGFSLRVR
jgi:hypothetical protein